jgi:hypothetical protein
MMATTTVMLSSMWLMNGMVNFLIQFTASCAITWEALYPDAKDLHYDHTGVEIKSNLKYVTLQFSQIMSSHLMTYCIYSVQGPTPGMFNLWPIGQM